MCNYQIVYLFQRKTRVLFSFTSQFSPKDIEALLPSEKVNVGSIYSSGAGMPFSKSKIYNIATPSKMNAYKRYLESKLGCEIIHDTTIILDSPVEETNIRSFLRLEVVPEP